MKGTPFLDTETPQVRQAQEKRVKSWEDVHEWGRERVSSIQITALERSVEPIGMLHALQVGRIGITRTMYGTSARIDVEGYSAAPVIATTNIQGHARPQLDGQEARINGKDKSFVFDLSEGAHHSHLSPDNIQQQLAFDPKLLDEISHSWFGNIPDRKTWQFRTSFGGYGTSWHASLHYIMRLISEASHPLTSRNIRHVEETLSVNLLENWAAQVGLDLSAEEHVIVPRVIRMAEEYMVEHAADAPTLTEIAQTLGISVRNLTMNFKKFRGCTPGQFLREQRLQAVRSELLSSDQEHTVSQIAASLGYIHMGEFAKAYRKRFGERPSETLKRTIL